MESDHALSQEDIDSLFQLQASGAPAESRTANAQRYDFRRSDRVPREQIRAIQVIHDTFARSLASSLSAYLRTYVTVNLIAVEQISFREFMASLPSPTCMSTMRITPFEGMAILEINPSLAYPLIEFLLGGGKVKPLVVQREMTDIERQILDTMLGLILQNLAFAWQSVAKVEFIVESHETEPGLLHVLPPNEAMVAVATEIQLGETSGMLNIGIPSSIVKSLRQKFDHQWSARRNPGTDDDSARMMERISGASVTVNALLEGATLAFSDLLRLSEGDILTLGRSINHPATLAVNGLPLFRSQVTVSGRQKAVMITDPNQ